MINLCKKAKIEMQDDNYAYTKLQSKKASKTISFEYANNICLKLFDMRKSETL